MKAKNSYDAVVVGAGPAGSTAAYLLASSGFKVLIIDKHLFPRNKLCAGLLTWKTVNLLAQIFKTPLDFLQSQGIITYQSSKYRVETKFGESIQGRLEFPFHFVDRNSYDFFWLKMAQDAGAEFISGEKVVSIDTSRSQITTHKGHDFFGRFILGADGVFSRIRVVLMKKGFINNKWKGGLATALEVFTSPREAQYLPDYPTIYFGLIPWGYAWCFPRENVRVLGICGLNMKAGKILRKGFDEFIKLLKISESQITSLKSHALPYGNYLTNPGHGNILMIGDACGLADPLLGEGIYYAHKSAQAAVKAAIESYYCPDAVLSTYAQHLRQTVITELKFARIGRQIIFSLPGTWPSKVIVSLLKKTPKKCEQTIQGQRSFKWLRPLDNEFCNLKL